MKVKEQLEAIEAKLARLDPDAVVREVAFLTGSNVRSPNLEREGGRSSDVPLPLPEQLDRRVRRLWDEYRRRAGRIEQIVSLMLITQDELLTRLEPELAPKVAEELADGISCANAWCSKLIVAPERVLAGRCRPCYEYRRSHDGAERTRDLCEAEMTR